MNTVLLTCRQAGLVLSGFLLFISASHAQTLINSGTEKLSLIELYTSQGCSSCPPADQWLSRLRQNPDLWNHMVPMAFHVDYWDYIGWKDPYAQPRFGERQRRYALEGGFNTVYTPGLLVDGQAWDGWRGNQAPKPKNKAAGNLVLDVSENHIDIQFIPTGQVAGKLQVNVAWLGFDLHSRVSAGENRGKRLVNDFVVLDLSQRIMRRENGAYVASQGRPDLPRELGELAVAAWVSDSSSLQPIQAAGGWVATSSR